MVALRISGVAKPGPTRALARALAHLALALEIDDDYMVCGVTTPTISLCGPPSVFQLIM